ncbi:MAG: DUF58 domain-containing protein [Gammaproteobacteria bacterium]|nr:DUF58 domain-containing protein [Gammaproteobacteria bacterium]MBU1654030.1 DUF58 domain-containing protein [Gammaproteobacteria bacterium]MBU1959699.1 DUF58 domain-containing protein [Gammaproteobacteria bacterium]
MRLDLNKYLRLVCPQADGALVVSARSIYILPTGFGLVYAVLLLLLLIGSINYANNLGFLLTFFLTALGLIAMVHTWRNLVGLRLRCGRPDPVFSGRTASFPFYIEATGSRLRPDIELLYSHIAIDACDAGPGQENRLNLTLTLSKRGRFVLDRCVVRSRYPLALFRAWTYVQPEVQCLVYPRPLSWTPQALVSAEADPGNGMARRDVSGTDYHGLREYRPGDPLKTIHWKSYAKGQELMALEFETPTASDLWLSWDAVPGPDMESRLGQLCHAVLDAAAGNLRFGLRLPGKTLPADDSPHHVDDCLRALALFGLES